jgi:hypothetical protein
MRKILITFLIFLFLIPTAFGYSKKRHKISNFNDFNCVLEYINVDFEDGTIILESRDYREPVVEITADYELYINGKLIKTDDRQKELIAEFYDTMDELLDRAKKIGIEGAKIGVEGAKLGIGTIASLIKLLSPHYDSDDLEREVEAKAEALEERAELLEEEAEEIENLAEDLEDIYEDMEDEIDELGALEWY